MSISKKYATEHSLVLVFLLFATQNVVAFEYGLIGSITAATYDSSNYDKDTLAQQLDFFATGKIVGNLSIFWEYVIDNSDSYFEADTERFNLKYRFNDRFNLAAGLFHSPLGYWNRNFHHGKLLYDTTERPFFIDFKRNLKTSYVMPVHINGIMANGNIETRQGTWMYNVLLGNGPGLNTSQVSDNERQVVEPGNFINPNNPSISFNIDYTPENSPIKFGIFGMRNEVQELDKSNLNPAISYRDRLLTQLIGGTEIIVRYKAFDAIGEYFAVRHSNEFNQEGTFSADAFYVQFGYRIQPSLKLIYRYSQLNFDQKDLYFKLLSSNEQYHNVATLRYDLGAFNAIKLEIDQQNNKDPNIHDAYTFRLQWDFLVDNSF